MSAATEGSATVEVNASARDVFAYLTDLDRLPGLSPENVRCEFLGESTVVELGATFRGHNKARDYEWHADCVVTVFEPDTAFAYDVPPKFEHATTWRYDITPTGDSSCTVTESFVAPLLELPEIYPGKIEGRRDNLEQACATTMANLRAAFE